MEADKGDASPVAEAIRDGYRGQQINTLGPCNLKINKK
jgi:hypothetical protein